ncbi:MAG: hypothetical protein HC806_08940 [Anaerolineae bacterium]|nr:hypothetical protein [Anaerolineae bacterium]
MVELTYRRRILEIALDLFLISVAYYLAFLVRAGFTLNEDTRGLLLNALPVALISGYIAFYIFRVYQGVWEYVSTNELIRFAGASLIGGVLCGVGLFFFSPSIYSFSTLFLFSIFLLVGLSGSRLSSKFSTKFLGDRFKRERASLKKQGLSAF